MLKIFPIYEGAEPSLAPDIVFDGYMGDLVLAGDTAGNRGGLRATAPLETAVIICLMTDARVSDEELRDGDENKGWHGDGYDLDTAGGERPIGSKFWLLRRRVINAETAILAEAYAVEALQPLIDQGAAAAVTATATPRPESNRLELTVTVTDRGGGKVAQEFAILWSSLNGR